MRVPGMTSFDKKKLQNVKMIRFSFKDCKFAKKKEKVMIQLKNETR